MRITPVTLGGKEYNEHDLACGECGARMRLRYTPKYGGRVFYGCSEYPQCSGTHSCHPDGSPQGTPADEKTKYARMAAHRAFDRIWKSGMMERNEAYYWLSKQLGIERKDCHIGQFGIETCEKVVAIVDQHVPIDAAPITEFKAQYRWLSNFHECEVELDGLPYPSTEHAYQAAKTLVPEEREAIRKLATPMLAKKAGGKVTLRDDWDAVKADIMLDLNRQKYFKHPELGAKLLSTGNILLVEGNYWHDNTWGICDCKACSEKGPGLNLLGKILMAVRDELRAANSAAV